MPSRGRVGIFNRSYYEEVLVVRVHPELLAREKLPPQLIAERLAGLGVDDSVERNADAKRTR